MRSLALLVLLGSLVGCGPRTTDPPDEPERCSTPPAGTPAAQREVTIGEGPADGFVVLNDGDTMDLIAGQQGGYMVVPTIRVAALPADGDALCLELSLDNSVASSSTEIAPGMKAQMWFQRSGDHLYAAGIYDLLAYDTGLSGAELQLDATVRGADFDGSDSCRIMLR